MLFVLFVRPWILNLDYMIFPFLYFDILIKPIHLITYYILNH
jgi:hypothetical protein